MIRMLHAEYILKMFATQNRVKPDAQNIRDLKLAVVNFTTVITKAKYEDT